MACKINKWRKNKQINKLKISLMCTRRREIEEVSLTWGRGGGE